MSVRLAFAVALVGVLWIVPAARSAEPPPDIARGQHIATAMTHCTGCHGADLGGDRSFPAGPGGERVFAGNLTSGAGGVGKVYTDADYVRAIRQGLRPNGAPLAVMPWRDFTVLTDSDVTSLVAYIRALPPVERSFPSSAASPDRATAPPDSVAGKKEVFILASGTPGAYLAQLGGCLNCHGADLHGGTLRGVVAPDISHGGIGTWTAAQFTAAMHSGRTPDGRTLAEPMPWRAIGELTDAELAVLYRYLEAAPARPPSATSS